jgi:hypothetical protein
MAEDSAPRSLADQLRGWSDEQLTRLLTLRPDLASPAPQDSTQLASRAGTRASVLRAVDQLDLLGLAVIDAVVALGGRAGLPELQEAVYAAPDAVTETVEALRARALLWGPVADLRALSILAETVGTPVSGLGPSVTVLLAGRGPAAVAALARDLGLDPTGDRQRDVEVLAEHLRDPGRVGALLEECEPRARAIVDHLERDGAPGVVESTDRAVSRAEAAGPVDQLLARGLVIARDRRHVVVPREVALALRDGRTTRHRVDEVPALVTGQRDQDLVDRAAAGAAFDLVRHVELLLEHWGTHPPAALRGGGLGVRDLRSAAALLHLDERATALHVEVAAAADLLAQGETDDLDAAWLPTDRFDLWAEADPAEQWASLAGAWLGSQRLMGLVGTRDESRKKLNALAGDLERAWVPEARRDALAQLAGLPRGQVLAAGTGIPSLVELVRWHRPRRPAQRAEALAWFLEEATTLGLSALGGLSVHGRALLDDPGAAAAALQPLLPEPVDHVLLQADLTAVAPGPLEHELAHNLALMADIESRGGATVYRFGADSVRRAFDSGWSAAEVHAFLATSSRTAVPQPLVYLVDDVARRFGTLRVGAAGSFLRSDDEAALTALVHDPSAAALRLRQIAPTVVVTDVPLDVVLPRLRELGLAPVVEAPDGTVRIARRDSHRARLPRRRPPSPGAGAARSAARAAATVGAIRAGDRAAATRPSGGGGGAGSPEPTGPMAALAALRDAAEARRPVWIAYVDNHGANVERVVDPVKVDAGWLTAFDHRADDLRTFAVHRITRVHPLPDGPRPDARLGKGS